MRLFITVFALAVLAAPAWADAPKCAQALLEKPSLEEIQRAQFAALKARLEGVRNDVVKLGPGRNLTLQLIAPATPNDPVLLMLPGVNRGLVASDPSITMLAAQGFGVALFNMSAQPLSVATLGKGERPAFQSKTFELADLASEVQALSERIKKETGAANVIPVSLSYSGAVSVHLKGFLLVIETVPMTSSAATNPQLEKYRQTLKSGEFFNPIFGPGITRSMLDTAYRQQWTKQVDAMIPQFNLPKERREDMIEGYLTLSRATEGFAWNTAEVARAGARRVFLLAGNEAPSLLRHQLDTFEALLKSRADTVAFLILESGHVIPSDQPVAYSAVIKMTASGLLPVTSGLVVIQPSTNGMKAFTGDAAFEMLKTIREQLPKNDEAAEMTGR